MTKYLFGLLFTASIFFAGCDEDFFAPVVNIDVPPHDPKPVLRLIANAGDTEIGALVTNSKGILALSTDYRLYPDATVQLYRNGALLTALTYVEEGNGDSHAASLVEALPDQPGDVYVLEAKLPGFDAVRTEQVMPPKPIVTDIKYTINGTIDEFGDRVNELKVDIQDPQPGTVNYYGISLVIEDFYVDPNTGDTTFYGGYSSLYSNDPLLTAGDYRTYALIFSDEGLPANGRYQLRCYGYNYSNQSRVFFRIATLTRDGFLYLRSKNQYENALGNPFAEPVTVHSNVEGGYGIFMMGNVLEVPL